MSAESMKSASVPLYLELLKGKAMDEQQEQQRDDEHAQQAALEALRHAHQLGLSESECMALAHVGGFANEFYRGIR